MTTMYNDLESCLTQKGGSSMKSASLTGKNHRLLHLMVMVLLALGTLAPVASARVLHADLGRWMRRDPLGYVDGWSLYEYVRSNAIKAVDPQGLECQGACLGYLQVTAMDISITGNILGPWDSCCSMDNPQIRLQVRRIIEENVDEGLNISSGCGKNCGCTLLMPSAPVNQDVYLTLPPMTFAWICRQSNGDVGRCKASLNLKASVKADVTPGVCTSLGPVPGPPVPGVGGRDWGLPPWIPGPREA